MALLGANGTYTRAFAARGLGRAKHQPARETAAGPARAQQRRRPLELTAAAIRALGQIGSADAVTTLTRLASEPATDPNLRLEAVAALGELHAADGLPILQDLMTDEWPTMRAAALRAVAAADPESFVAVLAGLAPDRIGACVPRSPTRSAPCRRRWPASACARCCKMRTSGSMPAVLAALARMKLDGLGPVLLAALERFRLRRPGGRRQRDRHAEARRWRRPALRAAYQRAHSDLPLQRADGGARGAGRIRRAPTRSKPCARRWPTRTGRCACARRTCSPSSIRRLRRRRLRPRLARRSRPTTTRVDRAGDIAARVHRDRLRHDRVRAGGARRAADVAELRRARREGVLQRPRGASRGRQLRRAGRRSARRRRRRTGLHDSRRAERPAVSFAARWAWRSSGATPAAASSSSPIHRSRTSTARYTAFGHVVKGMEVVDRIKPGDVIQRMRVWNGELRGSTRRVARCTVRGTVHRCQRVEALTASCRPSSSRPWQSSSPLTLIPPFTRGMLAARGPACIAAPRPPARRPALSVPRARLYAITSAIGRSAIKK